MKSLLLEIPADVVDELRLPPDERADGLRRELALHLYSRGLLPKAAARRLSGLERLAFDDLLGERRIPSRLTEEDIDTDLRGLDAWRSSGGEEPRG